MGRSKLVIHWRWDLRENRDHSRFSSTELGMRLERQGIGSQDLDWCGLAFSLLVDLEGAALGLSWDICWSSGLRQGHRLWGRRLGVEDLWDPQEMQGREGCQVCSAAELRMRLRVWPWGNREKREGPKITSFFF